MKTKECTKCKTERTLDSYTKGQGKDGLNHHCHPCRAQYRLDHKAKNPGLKSEQQQKWYDQAEDPSQYQRAYAKRFPGLNTANVQRYNAKKLKATPAWADNDKIDAMYVEAEWCTKNLGEAYHVDHIVPLRGKNVCGLHVEYNLNVITATENLKKSNKFE